MRTVFQNCGWKIKWFCTLQRWARTMEGGITSDISLLVCMHWDKTMSRQLFGTYWTLKHVCFLLSRCFCWVVIFLLSMFLVYICFSCSVFFFIFIDFLQVRLSNKSITLRSTLPLKCLLNVCSFYLLFRAFISTFKFSVFLFPSLHHFLSISEKLLISRKHPTKHTVTAGKFFSFQHC